ncbi:N-acylneuraminate cytidylyltransferase [Teleopsis dalmanni]|uniref:N-acylneuraminate cytidylyltransferase n=1 Tax=Teleopsis dalmanni TaxID=139649 RepID=UPI0018CEE87B|nr:N-acylneuraminate cytidylyltransferase [Teleopsis dalmanni]
MFYYLCYYCIYLVFLKEISAFESCNSEEVHAIILARGGSKGIKKKNLLKFGDYSLLARTILTIKRTKLFENIWISTNDDNIEIEGLKYGAIVHRRAEIFAQDNSSSIDAVKEFLSKYNTVNKFALFQCTSIFLKEHYIRQAFEIFKLTDCVFAVKRSHQLRWKSEGNKLVPINFDPANRPRRQDWPGELIETGMFYFSSRRLTVENKFQNERCGVVEVNHRDSLEIDDYDDVITAKCLVKKI